MNQESELDLITRSINGDTRAFRSLVESHQGLAYSIAFRFTRDELESEDITQEAFIKVWKSRARFDRQFRFKTWLAKIVTNLSLDYLKSGRRKKYLSRNVSEELPAPAENKLEASELKAIVYQLADQLTEKQKAVFILRDLETMTTEEVCQILQMSEGNMKSNLYYARLKIKQGLEVFYKI